MRTTTTATVLLFLFTFTFTFTLSPISFTSALHHRRILHQPLLPQDSIPPTPPPTPSPPSPPKYPFTTSTPDNSTFFPSYPAPPPPPSPASFASFPANISSLTVPHPSKPNGASSKLIVAAVAAVIAAVVVVSLAIFLHLRRRTKTRESPSFKQSKTQRSDNSSTISFNQAPNTHHIPKLQRPSQTSSEFLYLGTMVNSHPVGGGISFNGGGVSTTNYNDASDSLKMDSPELCPLPPLNTQQVIGRNNAEAVSSKDDESEEFYSPKGSINGRDSSNCTESASRRAFTALEVENFNGSTSNSSSTYSSSVPGSGSGSPARSVSLSPSPANNLSPRSSMPKSPDLIEIRNIASVPQQTPSPHETRGLAFQESSSPSPPSSSSPERYSRSEVSSPRISNASDQNVESPARISSPVLDPTAVIPTPPEIQASLLPEAASPSAPDRFLGRNEEASPRISNASDQNVESPVRFCSPVQDTTSFILTPPEIRGPVLPESTSTLPACSSTPETCLSGSEDSSPRISNASDQNVESLVRISAAVVPTSPMMRSEKSSPRISNASDQNVDFPAGIGSPLQQIVVAIPTSPEIRSEQSSPRISNASDQNVDSPATISSPVQHYTVVVLPLEPMQDLVLPGPASLLPPIACSPERFSMRSEDSSPRNSDASNLSVESPVRISSPVQHKLPSPASSSSPERDMRRSEESPSRVSNVSDQNKESPVRISSPVLHKSPSPASSSSPERDLRRSEESPPRVSNVSDQNKESPARISSPVQQKPPSPTSSSSPERHGRSEESFPRATHVLVQNMDSLVGISSPVQHNPIVTPPPPLPPPVSIPPPPPPPPPMSKVWESPITPTPPPKKLVCEPPTLITPLKPIAVESPSLISPMELPSNDSQTVKSDEDKESPNPKPKLKPLHWDKVRASSDREMVWDQLKCSSFKLNEEMIETLFVVNAPNANPKEATRWQVLPSPGQDNGNRVLDPKKAQNIAILLRALHVTVDEVCEGLMEGNAEILGTELLESLLKMAPTKEEEWKLKEYKDDPPGKLGAAERFLKAVVDIPYAFKRVDAMLYASNFESEVEYLKKSFATLEAACEELRTSRMFFKLLEAVLKTGNRMNVGTNRGDAHAFKLDTLLKLVDIKGADGKTTLLHFVVQEIIRSEGLRLSEGPHPTNDDAKCRKLGLQVVSALGSELSNVKKAAVMDAEVLTADVSKLSKGLGNIREIAETIMSSCDNSKFSESMWGFVKKAEEEICRIQAQESVALTLVKEITEYFHGNSAKEEAHPFRIFMVVRDFLTILDRVCKEVGMINERTMVSSAHKFPVPVNPMLQQGFHKRQNTCDDDEILPI